MATETFGFLAVASMVTMYAFEQRSHVYVLGFAASCAAASLYACHPLLAIRCSRGRVGRGRAATLGAGPSSRETD